MGNEQSTVANIVNKSCMSVTNDFVSTNISKTAVTSVNTQTFTINIGVADHCPINASQTIKADVAALGSVSSTSAKELATNLQGALSAALDQNTSMISGLAGGGGNSQSTTTNIQNEIEMSIRNRITNTNINEVAASSFNTNTMTMNIGVCQYSPISANQGIVSNVIAQNILTQISTDIASSSAVASLAASASQTSLQENKGLDDLVESIGKAVSSIIGAFTGPYAAVAIACVLMLCLCCAGLVYFMMSPAGQEAASKASNVGANFAKSKM